MIIFPMAGQSRRFADAGYSRPKFMLPLWDGTVFDYAVMSFAEAFASELVLFIYRETGGVRRFIEERAARLGIGQARFAGLDQLTAGQAETVEFGLDRAGVPSVMPLTIFNVDTFRLPAARPAGIRSDTSGWLEVFRGSGDNWSFVKPDGDSGLVAETAEKVAISDLCCSGLYHFGSAALFREALAIERENRSSPELYIAPVYNHLIAKGERIGYGIIGADDVVFCGVPKEYETLRGRPAPYRASWA